MLMITCIEGSDATRTLKLQGKVQGPWVEELRNACRAAASPPGGLRLDLAAVSFVDAAGAECLRELVRGGTPIVASSGFVAVLLGLDPR
jgi:hypothetical protein